MIKWTGTNTRQPLSGILSIQSFLPSTSWPQSTLPDESTIDDFRFTAFFTYVFAPVARHHIQTRTTTRASRNLWGQTSYHYYKLGVISCTLFSPFPLYFWHVRRVSISYARVSCWDEDQKRSLWGCRSSTDEYSRTFTRRRFDHISDITVKNKTKWYRLMQPSRSTYHRVPNVIFLMEVVNIHIEIIQHSGGGRPKMHLTRHPTTVVNDSRMVKYRSIYMDLGWLKGWRGVC